MAEILPVGTTPASSSDFTVAAGGTAALWLKGGYLYRGTKVLIERKDASGGYTPIGTMTPDVPCGTVSNPGSATETFRVTREGPCPSPGVGVDKS